MSCKSVITRVVTLKILYTLVMWMVVYIYLSDQKFAANEIVPFPSPHRPDQKKFSMSASRSPSIVVSPSISSSHSISFPPPFLHPSLQPSSSLHLTPHPKDLRDSLFIRGPTRLWLQGDNLPPVLFLAPWVTHLCLPSLIWMQVV